MSSAQVFVNVSYPSGGAPVVRGGTLIEKLTIYWPPAQNSTFALDVHAFSYSTVASVADLRCAHLQTRMFRSEINNSLYES